MHLLYVVSLYSVLWLTRTSRKKLIDSTRIWGFKMDSLTHGDERACVLDPQE